MPVLHTLNSHHHRDHNNSYTVQGYVLSRCVTLRCPRCPCCGVCFSDACSSSLCRVKSPTPLSADHDRLQRADGSFVQRLPQLLLLLLLCCSAACAAAGRRWRLRAPSSTLARSGLSYPSQSTIQLPTDAHHQQGRIARHEGVPDSRFWSCILVVISLLFTSNHRSSETSPNAFHSTASPKEPLIATDLSRDTE